MRSAAAGPRGMPHPLARHAMRSGGGAASADFSSGNGGSPTAGSGDGRQRRQAAAAAPPTPDAAEAARLPRLNPAHALLLREARLGSGGGRMTPEQVRALVIGVRTTCRFFARFRAETDARRARTAGLRSLPSPRSAPTLRPSTACPASPRAWWTSGTAAPTLPSSRPQGTSSLVRLRGPWLGGRSAGGGCRPLCSGRPARGRARPSPPPRPAPPSVSSVFPAPPPLNSAPRL